MFRFVRTVVRSRPKTSILLIGVLLVLLAAAASYAWAAFQCRAARTALAQGRIAEARERLDICLFFSFFWPGSAEVQLLAARAARLDGDFAAAETHLQRATQLEAGATEAIQLEYLLMRAQTGEEDEVSAALFNHVDNKHPESSLILQTLSRAYMHRLRYGPAYRCLNRWVQVAPHEAKPVHWRGWVLERLNNAKAAMKDYERALELDPELVDVRLRVAEMFLEDKLPLEALPHLQRLRKKHPDRADVMARLGQCRFLQGQSDEARRLMQAAVQKMPEDGSLLLHLARLELQDQRPVEAEQLLRRALKKDPSDTEAQYTLVSTLQLQGRTDEAANVLKQYEKHKALLERANRLLRTEAEHPSKDATLASEIGSILLGIGQERQGLYWLDQALLRNADHQDTHKLLADYFEKKGEKEKAAAHRRRLGS